MAGIPHALNVVSNAPFIIVGVMGMVFLLSARSRRPCVFVEEYERLPYWLFFIGLVPEERLDRWHVTVRLSELAQRDADFRREFLCHPRLLTALAAHEAIGIGAASYLWQVRAATVVEESPGLHWLILPACHRGCQALETLPADSCRVCGKPGGCSQAVGQGCTVWDLIHDIDERIIRIVQADSRARERLMRDPTTFFSEVAETRFRTNSASLGIREVGVAEDTETTVCFPLLATHQPHGVSLALERSLA